mmetsp:Transcript_157867/g.290891  ORF Transcript_157867/g.290891 Transcript_157867/m.290891 type:complete len:968 (+) Transcript_157867:116-3019(+)
MMPLLDIIPEGGRRTRSPSPLPEDDDFPEISPCRRRVPTPVRRLTPRTTELLLQADLAELDDKEDAPLPSLPADKSGWPLPNLSTFGARPFSGKLTAASSKGSSDRPTTRGTLMQAKLRASEIMHGQIWRGASLEIDLTQNLQDTLEFAHYRFDIMREASLASREKAHKWQIEADAKKAKQEQADPEKRDSSRPSHQCVQWPQRLRKSLGIMPAEDGTMKRFTAFSHAEDGNIKRFTPPSLPDIALRPLTGQSEAEAPKLAGKRNIQRALKGAAGKTALFGATKWKRALATSREARGVRFQVDDTQGDAKTDTSPKYHRMTTKDMSAMREEMAAKKKAQAQLGLFKNKLKQERPSALVAKHQKEWLRMSEEEKAIFANAFDGQLRKEAPTLDAPRLRFALRELGLGGRNKEEKQEMWSLCQEYIGILEEVDFERFCHEIVPAVRARFRDMHREQVSKLFYDNSGKDKMLTLANGQVAVEDFLGTPLMSVEARQELRSCYNEEVKEEERMRKLLDDEKKASANDPLDRSSLGGQTRSAWGPRPSFLTQWESKATKKLSLAQFEVLLQRTAERYEYKQLQRLRKIQQELNADAQTIKDLEADIVPLHISFIHYDLDNSGELDQVEMRSLLQEFGFLSGEPDQDIPVIKLLNKGILDAQAEKIKLQRRRTANVKREMEGKRESKHKHKWRQASQDHKNKETHAADLDELEPIEGSLDFKACLNLVFEVREEMKRKRRENTRKFFQRLDRDHSGALNMIEVSTLFEEMGLTPRCNRGQEEIKRLLANCDGDASGDLDFEEFEQLVQLVTEKLRSTTRFREMELGLKLGFTEQQVRSYRDCFWELDEDGSGHLDIDELRTLMRVLKQRIDGDELRMLMKKIDVDGDGHVDFSEFLRLIHSIAHVTEEDQPRRPEEEEEDYRSSLADESLKRAADSVRQTMNEPIGPDGFAKPRLTRRMSRLAAGLATYSAGK